MGADVDETTEDDVDVTKYDDKTAEPRAHVMRDQIGRQIDSRKVRKAERPQFSEDFVHQKAE